MFQGTDQFNETLTQFAQGAYQNPGETVDLSKLLFPAVGVDEAEGWYEKWGIDTGFTAHDATLPRHNSPHRLEISKTKGYYNCTPAALEIANWAPSLLQKSGPRFKERSLRTLMSAQFTTRQVEAVNAFKAGITAEDSSLGKFSTATTDVVTAIDTLPDKVAKGTYGRRPTHLIMGRSVWNTIRNHKSVLARTTGHAFAIFEDAFLSTLSFQGVQLVVCDTYANIGGKLTELLGKDIIALYNEETPSLDDLSAGKEFTLSPAGPEVISYKERGIYDVDMLLWSSDRQITNAGAAARLEIS